MHIFFLHREYVINHIYLDKYKIIRLTVCHNLFYRHRNFDVPFSTE
jgi:hypothetical protein